MCPDPYHRPQWRAGGLIEWRRAARQVEGEDGTVTIAALGFHDEGVPIGDFRKARATACVAVGLGRFLCPHCDGC